MDQIHAILAPLFDASGKTNTEIARAANIDPSQVTRYRAGTQSPSLPVLRDLLDALDAPVSVTIAAERAWLDRHSVRRATKPAAEAHEPTKGAA